MHARYKVALHGFGESELGALAHGLRTAPERVPAYEPASGLEDCDFVIADGDADGVAQRILSAGRMRGTVFVGEHAPQSALSHLQRPVDPQRLLAELDHLLALRIAAAPVLTLEAEPPLMTEVLDWPALEAPTLAVEPPASIAADPQSPVRVETPAYPRAQAPHTAPPAAGRALAKAAAKAAARRARLAHAGQPGDAPAAVVPDVLVLDDSEIARRFLCHLLGLFGFRTHAVASSTQALELLARQPFAAVFLDIVLGDGDDSDGLALCQRIKSDLMGDPVHPPAVMIVSGRAPESERVRAKLAGCDAFLGKPISRGDVARALETCGVPLPADARRAQRI